MGIPFTPDQKYFRQFYQKMFGFHNRFRQLQRFNQGSKVSNNRSAYENLAKHARKKFGAKNEEYGHGRSKVTLCSWIMQLNTTDI